MQNRIVHDEELLARLQRGDEWVYQLLVRRFREKVFSTAFGLTFDMEESLRIFEEVFQEIYDGAVTTDIDISLNELVHRITVHRCLHQKKTWFRGFNPKKSSVGSAPPSRPTGEDGVSTDTPASLQEQRIKTIMGTLPESAQTVYILREVQKLSYEEIANVMGARPAAMRTTMLRTRQKIYLMLQTENEAPDHGA